MHHLQRTAQLATSAVILTLLLAGAFADRAAAKPQSPGVDAANSFIGSCFLAGGDPVVLRTGDQVVVACVFPDGSSVYCDFTSGSPHCIENHLDGGPSAAAAMVGSHGAGTADPGPTPTQPSGSTHATTGPGSATTGKDGKP